MHLALPTPPVVPALDRRKRLLVSGQLWLMNVGLLAVVCREYLDLVRPGPLRAWLFLVAGLFSCSATLSLLPGLSLLGIAALTRNRRLLALLAALVWSLVLLAVFVDTRIYGIFRYHFNGLVWNVLTTPGADEAVHISSRELGLMLVVTGLSIALQYLTVSRLWSRAARPQGLQAGQAILLRPRVAWGVLLLPSMLFTAASYAYGDLLRDPQIMAYAQVYPFFPHVTIKHFAERYLGLTMKERPEVELPERGILLDYPHRAPALRRDGPQPDIVIIVIDSLRADMLSSAVMPRTHALAERGRVFRDHLSTGNATRFGLFGLVYGLHGSYWKPILHEHRSPALVDALLERGYRLHVFSSASMDFPEFRSTAWVRIEDQVEDRIPSERPGGRDDGVARRFEEWLAERAPDDPCFAFLLLDAPHQSYAFPPECAPFQPCADGITYASMAEGASPETTERVFNRYRNAVHYDDEITGRVLDALSAHGRLDGALVVVTGDHGEEFFENGFWGHTSNFTAAQVQVPLVLAGPGVPPGIETRPTSHLDLPATLLELLGADPALRADWTLGRSLLDPVEERVRVVAGWDTLALQTPSGILSVPTSAHRGGLEVHDPSWERVLDDADILEREGQSLGTLALECRRFLR